MAGVGVTGQADKNAACIGIPVGGAQTGELVREETPGPEIREPASLSEALSAMLLAETDHVRVVDGAGTYRGTLTVAAIVKTAMPPAPDGVPADSGERS